MRGGTVSARARESEPERSPLSERSLRILDFEREWWQHAGAKEADIRSQFGLSAARYYQLLNALIDSPDAVRHDPMLVRRLLRARDARTHARAQRSFTRPGQGTTDSRPRDEEPTD